MTSRETILAAVARNKPEPADLPSLTKLAQRASAGFSTDLMNRFTDALKEVGGQVVAVRHAEEIVDYIQQNYRLGSHRVITTLPALSAVADVSWSGQQAHQLADVELAVLEGHFGVVENGAVWLTESLLLQRATPFIAQHLGVVLRATDLVPTMHDAYARIGGDSYTYSVFVAGPSKTADIEQSLVLGAHGPKTMTVFLVM